MFYVYADGESIFSPLDESLSIFSPKVTLELGKSGSFQFSIPKTNDYYGTLEQLKTKIIVNIDNTEIFRGRVLSISRGFNNIKNVYCEGILSYLVDSVQRPSRYNGKAKDLYESIIRKHNSMVEADKQFSVSLGSYDVENPTVIIPGKKEKDDAYFGEDKYEQAIIESIVGEWQTTYDYINSIFISYLGGYLVAKHDFETDKNYIDYISTDSLDSKVSEAQELDKADHEIEFGVNMIDLSEEGNAEDMFTVLIPLGDGDEEELTIESSTNKYSNDSVELVTINGKQIGIADREAREQYGSIIQTHVFSNVNNANTLFTDGVRYLKSKKNIPVTYSVRAIDLHFVNRVSSQIEIGDVVKVMSSPHNIRRYLLCTKIEYDLANPGNTVYTFGNPEQTLTERYKKDKDKQQNESDNDRKQSAKGGGNAAGAAKDDAVDAADGALKELYDAYIKVDPEAGKVTMATLYKSIKDGKENLKTMAGIDLDSGPDGSRVNIYSMYEDIENNIKSLNTFKEEANRDYAKISMLSEYQTTADANKAKSEIETWASGEFAKASMLAEYQTKDDASTARSKIEAWANGEFAKASMLAEYQTKDDASTARSKIEAWANGEFAKASMLAEYQTKDDASTARSKIEAWANGEFAKASMLAEYQTKDDASTARSKIEAWANGEFAKASMLAEYQTKDDASTARSKIEAWANGEFAKATIMSDYRTPCGKSLAQLELIVNKAKSILTATTNWGKLQFDDDGKITGTVTAAGTTITSDALKSSIENYTNFASFIDGKLTYSTTTIKQKADDNGAKINLVARFGKDAAGSITLEAVKTGFLDKIKSTIKLTADNIEADAKESISLYAKDKIIADAKSITIKGFLEADNSHFKKQVYFDKSISVLKNSIFGEGLTVAQDITSRGYTVLTTNTVGAYIEEYLKNYVKKSEFDNHTHSVNISHTHNITSGQSKTSGASVTNAKTGKPN